MNKKEMKKYKQKAKYIFKLISDKDLHAIIMDTKLKNTGSLYFDEKSNTFNMQVNPKKLSKNVLIKTSKHIVFTNSLSQTELMDIDPFLWTTLHEAFHVKLGHFDSDTFFEDYAKMKQKYSHVDTPYEIDVNQHSYDILSKNKRDILEFWHN